jgi:hypothetical protein
MKKQKEADIERLNGELGALRVVYRRAGEICAIQANYFRNEDKHPAPFTPRDFFPWLPEDEEELSIPQESTNGSHGSLKRTARTAKGTHLGHST